MNISLACCIFSQKQEQNNFQATRSTFLQVCWPKKKKNTVFTFDVQYTMQCSHLWRSVPESSIYEIIWLVIYSLIFFSMFSLNENDKLQTTLWHFLFSNIFRSFSSGEWPENIWEKEMSKRGLKFIVFVQCLLFLSPTNLFKYVFS